MRAAVVPRHASGTLTRLFLAASGTKRAAAHGTSMQYADKDVEARRRLQSLAAQGDADAQFELAEMLFLGHGGPEDLVEVEASWRRVGGELEVRWRWRWR